MVAFMSGNCMVGNALMVCCCVGVNTGDAAGFGVSPEVSDGLRMSRLRSEPKTGTVPGVTGVADGMWTGVIVPNGVPVASGTCDENDEPVGGTRTGVWLAGANAVEEPVG